MAEANSQISVSAQWAEGHEEDFRELHEAIRDDATQKFRAVSDAIPVEEGFSDSDSSAAEEESPEPPADQPGQRLLWAAQYGRLELVRELIRVHPASLLSYADDDGYTALHRACYSNHKAVAQELLLTGAELLQRTTEDGWTPLHSACRWNAAQCVELLLQWGADVNQATDGGQTPLHLAAFCKQSSETLQLLFMQPRLDVEAKNCQGDTAEDIAKRNGSSVGLFSLHEAACAKTVL